MMTRPRRPIGRPPLPPEQRSTDLHLTLSPADYDALYRCCRCDGHTNVQAVVKAAIASYLKQRRHRVGKVDAETLDYQGTQK